MTEQTFGERLRAARERRRLTKAEFARLAGVSGPGAQLWETGRMTFPRADTLVRLAEILEVDLRWLITGEGTPDLFSAERLERFPLETMLHAIANKGFDVIIVARGSPIEEGADAPDGEDSS
jgi:transcriptional regulator with XRE-family HTH domain